MAARSCAQSSEAPRAIATGPALRSGPQNCRRHRSARRPPHGVRNHPSVRRKDDLSSVGDRAARRRHARRAQVHCSGPDIWAPPQDEVQGRETGHAFGSTGNQSIRNGKNSAYIPQRPRTESAARALRRIPRQAITAVAASDRRLWTLGNRPTRVVRLPGPAGHGRRTPPMGPVEIRPGHPSGRRAVPGSDEAYFSAACCSRWRRLSSITFWARAAGISS
jgi:hypothetical protein